MKLLIISLAIVVAVGALLIRDAIFTVTTDAPSLLWSTIPTAENHVVISAIAGTTSPWIFYTMVILLFGAGILLWYKGKGGRLLMVSALIISVLGPTLTIKIFSQTRIAAQDVVEGKRTFSELVRFSQNNLTEAEKICPRAEWTNDPVSLDQQIKFQLKTDAWSTPVYLNGTATNFRYDTNFNLCVLSKRMSGAIEVTLIRTKSAQGNTPYKPLRGAAHLAFAAPDYPMGLILSRRN